MLSRSIFTLAATWCELAAAQTFSSCNPLYTTGCPANTALGKAISVDFTKGEVNSFTAGGHPTYDSEGVHFTVSRSGEAPQLASVFYIMFGKVQISLKSAPGAGIVSSLVLQSDTLDEIDLEWLGADDSEVQTNYFGKGDVTTYNRGAFHPAPNNQAEFITYTIEWTAEQIIWSVGNKVIRVLTPATADTNQYPQSPMQVKFGSWSGGDSSNPSGTISWARGPTDYSKGPFTMSVRSIAVTDYSTGTQYKYGDNSGNRESIEAVGGEVNGNSGLAGSAVASADVPAITSASPSIPAGLGDHRDSTAHQTGWPWVATTTLSTVTALPTVAGIPEGWVITSSGKIQPASSAAILPTSIPFSSADPSPWPWYPPFGGGLDLSTGFDDRGSPTTHTRQYGWQTMPRSYDDRGFLITTVPMATAAGPGGQTQPGACSGPGCGSAGEVVGTSLSRAVGAQQNPSWQGAAVLGTALIQRLLL